MGCLKLHTEKNYTTLKVVYSAVNTSVLEKQEEKNNTAFLEVVYRNAQSSGGGLGTANDWLGYAGYGEAGLSGVQMGMIEYRQSLSISSKIGTFSNFSTAYRALGTTGKVLGGAATYVGAPLNTYMDYKSMQSGEIGGGRFSYRTAGTAVGIGVGAYFGAIPGAVIGGGFWAGEKMYDGYMYWQTQMSIYLTNFENGLKNGWVPGR
jgi:hypothetical protein